jgi:hypothetical protein
LGGQREWDTWQTATAYAGQTDEERNFPLRARAALAHFDWNARLRGSAPSRTIAACARFTRGRVFARTRTSITGALLAYRAYRDAALVFYLAVHTQ